MILQSFIPVSVNFFLDEYVSDEFYREWGAKAIWWLRPELIIIDQFLRDRFKIPMLINDWATGGQRQQSGLRYPEATIGAGDSLHKFGCASDTRFQDKGSEFYEEVRQDIIKNWKELYKPLGLTTIEAKTARWLHKDVRNIPGQKSLNIIYPQL